MPKDTHQQFDWSGSLEQLEDRLVMSADPLGGLVEHHSIADELTPIEHHATTEQPPALDHHLQSAADFWIDPDNLQAIDAQLGQIEQSLANAHNQSGLTQVRADYGFDGTGQTVAIIDSGIAYDHFALGGGLGSNYRVVGGWDFTGENDANPYDDGASGSHGTHVAGIVGASGGTHSGVAPGVDLVGLRVFDDAGAGYFSWVESALDWIHTNRNSFENPITAVNLSLGVASWNADTIPNWATLENEFAQLEADGIFVAVSAGNSFTSYNATGLSYPAASPYVIPVASVDDSGLLSYFSQRNSRVIAAPGRGIISTVPDYAGNNNGIADDYASFSGTSMASPYVAGASVIIREAMEFVGYTNITQDTIYDHMIATADSFFDSATNQSFNRLNLEAAIDALMPTDDFGSTIGSAYNLGILSGTTSVSGLIGTLGDQDHFSFTASATGTVSFTAASEQNMVPLLAVNGAIGVVDNNTLTFSVTAGESYAVSLQTVASLGYYDVSLSFESFAPVIVKTEIAPSGSVYTLDSDNWLSINGNKLWSKTQDFDFAPNSNFIWHSTNGLLQRHSGRGWESLDRDADRFEINSKSKIYSLGEDNYLSVNGVVSWGRTNDFHVTDNMDLFWHNDTGLFQKLENGGGWSTLDTSVQKFAIRSDGLAFALTSVGNVTIDGVQAWSNISDMYINGSGQLVIQDANNTYNQMGDFFLSSDLALQNSQLAQANAGHHDTQSIFSATAAVQVFAAGLPDFGTIQSRTSPSLHFSGEPVTAVLVTDEVEHRAFANWETVSMATTSSENLASDTSKANDEAYTSWDVLDVVFESIS